MHHISHFLGWLSTVLCALLLAKIIGRLSKRKKLNQHLRKIHKPLGLIVIGVSLLHGIACFLMNPFALPSTLSGILAFTVIILLAVVNVNIKMPKKSSIRMSNKSSLACTKNPV